MRIRPQQVKDVLTRNGRTQDVNTVRTDAHDTAENRTGEQDRTGEQPRRKPTSTSEKAVETSEERLAEMIN